MHTYKLFYILVVSYILMFMLFAVSLFNKNYMSILFSLDKVSPFSIVRDNTVEFIIFLVLLVVIITFSILLRNVKLEVKHNEKIRIVAKITGGIFGIVTIILLAIGIFTDYDYNSMSQFISTILILNMLVAIFTNIYTYGIEGLGDFM